jgi:hypothetical protein
MRLESTNNFDGDARQILPAVVGASAGSRAEYLQMQFSLLQASRIGQ